MSVAGCIIKLLHILLNIPKVKDRVRMINIQNLVQDVIQKRKRRKKIGKKESRG